jgi:hypothetical protein
MNISLFLNNVNCIERSGLVNLDTTLRRLGEDSATISWECAIYGSFRIYYFGNNYGARLYLIEKGKNEKLMQAKLSMSEDPTPLIEKLLELLAILLAVDRLESMSDLSPVLNEVY